MAQGKSEGQQGKARVLLSEAASAMGSVRSEEKAKASRANGALGGRPLKDLLDIPCTCNQPTGYHKSYCPRGMAERRRGESLVA